MLAYMEREQAEYEELERVGLFKALREFQEGELSISHFRKSLSGIRARLLEAYLDSNSALFQGIIQSLDRLLIMNRDKLRASKDKVGRYRSQLRHARARLADMLRVNRALQADPEWYRVFVEQGLEPLDSGEILYRGRHHSGTFYRFRKPA